MLCKYIRQCLTWWSISCSVKNVAERVNYLGTLVFECQINFFFQIFMYNLGHICYAV